VNTPHSEVSYNEMLIQFTSYTSYRISIDGGTTWYNIASPIGTYPDTLLFKYKMVDGMTSDHSFIMKEIYLKAEINYNSVVFSYNNIASGNTYQIGPSTSLSSSVYETDKWTHLVSTIEGNTMKFYKDGILEESQKGYNLDGSIINQGTSDNITFNYMSSWPTNTENQTSWQNSTTAVQDGYIHMYAGGSTGYYLDTTANIPSGTNTWEIRMNLKLETSAGGTAFCFILSPDADFDTSARIGFDGTNGVMFLQTYKYSAGGYVNEIFGSRQAFHFNLLLDVWVETYPSFMEVQLGDK
jgi:hypothetical protein